MNKAHAAYDALIRGNVFSVAVIAADRVDGRGDSGRGNSVVSTIYIPLLFGGKDFFFYEKAADGWMDRPSDQPIDVLSAIHTQGKFDRIFP